MLIEKTLVYIEKFVCHYRSISLVLLNENLQRESHRISLPLSSSFNQIKKKRFLRNAIIDCLVIWHPDHQHDYYNIVLTLNAQFKCPIIDIAYFGSSEHFEYLPRRCFDLVCTMRKPLTEKERLGKPESDWYYKVESLVSDIIN